MIEEEFSLPIDIGDTVLGGRFKNKKIKIKSIEVNDKGDLMINGKNAAKFRIPEDQEQYNESRLLRFGEFLIESR